MRSADLTDRHNGDADCGAEQHQRNDRCGQRLRFSMPVGMILVGGASSDAQPHPDYQRGKNVSGRLDSVRDERIGVTDDSRNQLDQHQHGVDKKSRLRPTDTAVRCASHRAPLL